MKSWTASACNRGFFFGIAKDRSKASAAATSLATNQIPKRVFFGSFSIIFVALVDESSIVVVVVVVVVVMMVIDCVRKSFFFFDFASSCGEVQRD